MKIDWDDRRLLRLVAAATDEVAKEGAEIIAEDAKRILERKASDSTGTLASEIDVRTSKYQDGGYTVMAQGPGNYTRYYASFVELGTSKMAPIPYLRPALKRNKYRIYHRYEKALDRITHE